MRDFHAGLRSAADDYDDNRTRAIRAQFAVARAKLERLIWDSNAPHGVRQRAALRLGDLKRQEDEAIRNRPTGGYGS